MPKTLMQAQMQAWLEGHPEGTILRRVLEEIETRLAAIEKRLEAAEKQLNEHQYGGGHYSHYCP